MRRILVASSAVVVVFALLPVLNSLASAQATVYRSYLQVFTDATNLYWLTPVLPLAISLLVGLPLSHATMERGLVNVRLRSSSTGAALRRYVLPAMAVSAAMLALFIIVAGVWSFVVAPTLSLYDISPREYGMSRNEAFDEEADFTTFSWLIPAGGYGAFVVGHAIWSGLIGALFGALSALSLLLIPNTVIALAIPWVAVLCESIVALLVSGPRYALMYSAVPSGLQPIAPAALIAVPLVVAIAVAGAFTVILRRPQYAVGLT